MLSSPTGFCQLILCWMKAQPGKTGPWGCQQAGATPAFLVLRSAPFRSNAGACLRLTVQHMSRQGLTTPASGTKPTQRGNREEHSHVVYARRHSSHVHSCTSLQVRHPTRDAFYAPALQQAFPTSQNRPLIALRARTALVKLLNDLDVSGLSWLRSRVG